MSAITTFYRFLVRGGPTAKASTDIPKDRELLLDTDTKELRVGDGATPGGIPLTVGTPTASRHPANKAYVDARVASIGGGTGGGWSLVRNPDDYIQSIATGATGRCITCAPGPAVGGVGGLPWAYAGIVPALASLPAVHAYIYILRNASDASAYHAYARITPTGALEIVEHGASVGDYRCYSIAEFATAWLSAPRAIQVSCSPGSSPVVQVLDGLIWTTISGAESSFGAAPAWGATSLATSYHVQAYDWPLGRCPLGMIIIGAPLSAGELATWSACGRMPYWVEVGGSANNLDGSTLQPGRRYLITSYVAGDDFTNVGAAANAAGESFISSGTTPAVWAGGSAPVQGGTSTLIACGAISIPVVGADTTSQDSTRNGLTWSISAGLVPIARSHLSSVGEVGVSGIQPINMQSSAHYVLAAHDAGMCVDCSSADPSVIEIPAGVFRVGAWVDVRQVGSGRVTLSPAAGVSIVARTSRRKLLDRYAQARLHHRAEGAWYLTGQLDEDVRVLAHFSGAALVDECGGGVTSYGGATYSTAAAKFGASGSLYIPGAGCVGISTPLVVGVIDSSDFEVEWWYYPTDVSAHRALLHVNAGGNRGLHVHHNGSVIYVDDGMAAAGNTGSVLPTTGVWYHIRCSVEYGLWGGTSTTGRVRLFVNGALALDYLKRSYASQGYSQQNYGLPTTILVGRYYNGGVLADASGYFAELVMRRCATASNFSVPESPETVG